MTEAEREFQKLSWDMLERWNHIKAFREVSEMGIPLADRLVYQKAEAQFELLAQLPIFTDRESFIRGKRDHIQKFHDDWLARAKATTDPAALAFAHSIVDDLALRACRVSMLAAPEAWLPVMKGKQVTIQEVRDSDFLTLLRQLLETYLKTLDRQSLPRKVNHLTALCAPPKDWVPFAQLPEFKFDTAKLKAIDEMRHAFVHGGRPLATIPTIEEDLAFMEQMGRSFCILLHQKYGFAIDVDQFGRT